MSMSGRWSSSEMSMRGVGTDHGGMILNALHQTDSHLRPDRGPSGRRRFGRDPWRSGTSGASPPSPTATSTTSGRPKHTASVGRPCLLRPRQHPTRPTSGPQALAFNHSLVHAHDPSWKRLSPTGAGRCSAKGFSDVRNRRGPGFSEEGLTKMAVQPEGASLGITG